MGIAEPLALVFASLYGVLVLFYLWERWRRRVLVPSLLLWEAVREDTIRARRFRPDLLFLLQLLLLTCLIVGLARPYWHGVGDGPAKGRHIFVLDTSASMQTRERGGSRFDAARTQALRRLHDVHANDEVMLIGAARTPEVLVGFTRDHSAVERALHDAQPTDTGGDLTVGLAFAQSARQRSDVPTSVDVFTDLPRSALPEPLRPAVTVFQVGETDDNLAIEGVQIYQGRFQDYRGARAYVQVENFAHREGHGFLTVQVEDQVVERSGFTIPARESKSFLIDDFPQPGRVVAELEVADALSVDNRGFGWIRPARPVRLLVVSSPSPLVRDLQTLAAATPALQLESVEPSAFRPEQAGAADIVIFHRFVPATEPATNALYVYPPADNPLFPASADATNVEVLDWNAHHPALESLRPLAALPLHRAHIMTAPAWSQTLLWSRTMAHEFPLAFAGERHGRRIACLTFDLEAERLLGTDNVNLLLFFMNLLGWLTPEGPDTVVVDTGDVYPFSPLAAHPLRVTDPRGETRTLPMGDTTVEPLLAGEYRIRSNGTARTLLANFFDPQESDIGRASREPPIAGRASPAESARYAGPDPSHSGDGSRRWFYAAAAALLLLEWAVARWAAERGAV